MTLIREDVRVNLFKSKAKTPMLLRAIARGSREQTLLLLCSLCVQGKWLREFSMQAYLIPISQSLLNNKEWACRQIRPFKESLTVKPCILLRFSHLKELLKTNV